MPTVQSDAPLPLQAHLALLDRQAAEVGGRPVNIEGGVNVIEMAIAHGKAADVSCPGDSGVTKWSGYRSVERYGATFERNRQLFGWRLLEQGEEWKKIVQVFRRQVNSQTRAERS